MLIFVLFRVTLLVWFFSTVMSWVVQRAQLSKECLYLCCLGENVMMMAITMMNTFFFWLCRIEKKNSIVKNSFIMEFHCSLLWNVCEFWWSFALAFGSFLCVFREREKETREFERVFVSIFTALLTHNIAYRYWIVEKSYSVGRFTFNTRKCQCFLALFLDLSLCFGWFYVYFHRHKSVAIHSAPVYSCCILFLSLCILLCSIKRTVFSALTNELRWSKSTLSPQPSRSHYIWFAYFFLSWNCIFVWFLDVPTDSMHSTDLKSKSGLTFYSNDFCMFSLIRSFVAALLRYGELVAVIPFEVKWDKKKKRNNEALNAMQCHFRNSTKNALFTNYRYIQNS